MPRLLGILTGTLLAALILSSLPSRITRPTPGPLLSESDGPLHHLVLQYTPDSEFTLPTYKDLLQQLPANIKVTVLTPDAQTFESFKNALGPIPPTLTPLFIPHPLTCWSRDRWLCRAPSPTVPTATLLTPAAESASATWPERAGDSLLASDLAFALPTLCTTRRSNLLFDAGDFLADNDTLFVTPALRTNNLGRTVQTESDLLEALHHLCGPDKKIILLTHAPPHHAGMFMTAVGNHTVLVGSPALALEIDPTLATDTTSLPGGPDLSPQTQSLFDSVASQIQSAGYTVLRIPCLPSKDNPKVYLTWSNGLLDEPSPNHRTYYLPTYQNHDPLNTAAAQLFSSLGIETHPVDVTQVYPYGGTLHCLINVLDRETR